MIVDQLFDEMVVIAMLVHDNGDRVDGDYG